MTRKFRSDHRLTRCDGLNDRFATTNGNSADPRPALRLVPGARRRAASTGPGTSKRRRVAEYSDPLLVACCLEGKAGAWDELVDRYGRLIYSIPRKLGLPASDADDVLQTVFGIVLRRLESLSDANRLSAWLTRITYREAWRVIRRRRATNPVPDTVACDETPAEEEVERQEQIVLVRRALATLDERDRRLLQMLFFEGARPDYQKTAEALGMPVGSIGPTRARAFKRLEAGLDRLQAETHAPRVTAVCG